jgi:crotonobetaine/carnitine-CoA ligase
VQVLDQQAEEAGDRTFFVCGSDESSYAALSESSMRLAGGLRALGLNPADRIAVLSENSLAFVQSFFACMRLGLIQVPLNIYLRGEFLRYQLEHSGCVAAIVDGPGLQAIRRLDPPPDGLKHVIVVGNSGDDVAFGDLIRSEPFAGSFSRASDIAAIGYTSGTTGMPKGCVIPHGMFTRVYPQHERAGYVTAQDRIVTPAPMFHIGTLAGMLCPALQTGASVISIRRFSASSFLHTARDSEGTVIYGVGSLCMMLLGQPPSAADEDPGSLRLAMLAPVPPEKQMQFQERFKIPVIAESYGQTECLPISMGDLKRPGPLGSAGKPPEYFEVRIVDGDDDQVPHGEVGEIVVRPRRPNMMFKGYWENNAATIETSRNYWHHTGDLGRQDPDGTLWILDRKKDFIRRRGENVSSLELEAAIDKFPGISQVAVHAVPSDVGEDEIKACIVPRTTISAAELFAFFRATLPYFAVPRYVELLDELPTGSAGRVSKQALRERGMTEDTWDFEALDMTIDREERRQA